MFNRHPVSAAFLLSAFLLLSHAVRAAERWAGPALRVTDGLELWLDAARLNAARQSQGQTALKDGDPVETWFDASGQGRHVSQAAAAARPRLVRVGQDWLVRFDGADDHLRRTGLNRSLDACTVFVVAAPQRPGHGETGGVYLENVGDCREANFIAAGRAGAANIQKTIDYMTTQLFVRRDHVIVLGQSAGGWDALALASENPDLRAVLNFDGGRGGHFQGRPNNNCRPDQLVDAVRTLGPTDRVPTLLIYAENDTFFGPKLSKSMFEAWTGAGGQGEYHLMPPFDVEGHLLVDYPKAVDIWAPIVKRFLAEHP